MATKLSFDEVRKLIKNGNDSKLIEAADRLLGLILICSPIALGPAAATSLSLISVKNELIKLGKGIFKNITGKKEKDFLEKQRRMEMAYCLICYTVLAAP